MASSETHTQGNAQNEEKILWKMGSKMRETFSLLVKIGRFILNCTIYLYFIFQEISTNFTSWKNPENLNFPSNRCRHIWKYEHAVDFNVKFEVRNSENRSESFKTNAWEEIFGFRDFSFLFWNKPFSGSLRAFVCCLVDSQFYKRIMFNLMYRVL